MTREEEAIKVLLNEWKCIDRNDGVNCDRKCASCDLVMDSFVLKDAYNTAIKSLKQEPKWIPMTTRLMTEEERARYRERLEYVDDAVIFNCPLPDDGQEVLITAYGETELDTFYSDSIDGCYFENRDIDDVDAWMPKPKPYKPQKSEG